MYGNNFKVACFCSSPNKNLKQSEKKQPSHGMTPLNDEITIERQNSASRNFACASLVSPPQPSRQISKRHRPWKLSRSSIVFRQGASRGSLVPIRPAVGRNKRP